MSDINAPQWFKDAVRDWPTAVWYPIPTEKYLDDDFVPLPTVSSSITGFSNHVTDYVSEADPEYFAPFEKYGRWGKYSFGAFEMPEGWLTNGAIIIVGHTTVNMNDYNRRKDIYNSGDNWNYGKFVGAKLSQYNSDNAYIIGASRYEAGAVIVDEYKYPIQNTRYKAQQRLRRYEDYTRPQYRCAVLAIAPNGDVVVGDGHPAYAGERSFQDRYEFVGNFDQNKLQYLNWIDIWHSVSYEEGNATSTFPLNTFIEVLMPNVTPIAFPPIDHSEAEVITWWKNRHYCSDVVPPIAVDKRGFPIGAIPAAKTGIVTPDVMAVS